MEGELTLYWFLALDPGPTWLLHAAPQPTVEVPEAGKRNGVFFYILHQTVIVLSGYYLCEMRWSVGSKFAVIIAANFLICFVLIRYVIMPVKWLRLPLDIKANSQKHQKQEVILAATL